MEAMRLWIIANLLNSLVKSVPAKIDLTEDGHKAHMWSSLRSWSWELPSSHLSMSSPCDGNHPQLLKSSLRSLVCPAFSMSSFTITGNVQFNFDK